MCAESSARSHAQEFTYWHGDPDFSDEEAKLPDLLALYRATKDLAREQRDLLGLYDTDEELFGDW